MTSDMLKKIPGPFDQNEISKKYPTKYEDSMNTVIMQEVIKYNKLLILCKKSLEDLLKAIKGLVVMSTELEEMSISIFNNQVPKLWASKSYPSLMPLDNWVEDLCRRIKFIKNWVDNGTPKVFWISGFYFPQGFLTGLLQNFARKRVIAIDTVSFSFPILSQSEKEILKRPDDGAYIKGVFIEGARYDTKTKQLDESKPKELFTKVPIIWLKPEENRPKPTNIYKCPCYKILTRAGELSTTGHSTNYVISIEIPSDKPQEHWVRRGVACLLSLRYFDSEI